MGQNEPPRPRRIFHAATGRCPNLVDPESHSSGSADTLRSLDNRSFRVRCLSTRFRHSYESTVTNPVPFHSILIGCLMLGSGCLRSPQERQITLESGISLPSSPTPDSAPRQAEPETVLAVAQSESEPDPIPAAAAVLVDPDASEDRLRAAAAVLLDNDTPDWSALISTLGRDGVPDLLVEMAAAEPARAARLLVHTSEVQIEAPERIRLCQSLARTRSRPTARALIRELEHEGSRVAAYDALSAMTGRADLGPNPAAWKSWDAAIGGETDQAWLNTLMADLIARSTQADERASRAERQLADAYRRLYLVTDAAGRPAILSELLKVEQLGVLQTLGFELCERELAANVGLDSTVADAAIGLLEHRDAQVRARAARLVSRLAPPSAAEVVSRVLAAETSPVAAEPLLQAAARWPSPQLVEPVLRWLADERTREAACQAGVALFDAGLLVGDEARERVRAMLMPLPQSPTAARLILLGQAGNEADRDAIAGLLHAEDAAVRAASADALARSDAGAANLIEAAIADPAIAPDVLVALARHNNLDAAADKFDRLETWQAAFDLATPTGGRASIASRILTRFAGVLTPEQKTVYEAASDPAG